MIVSAHQPSYNPWLGYFHKILLSDVFVVMDDVQFEKNSFINRNRINHTPSGLMLTIPCSIKNYKFKKISEIEISSNHWIKKHLKSIYQAYNKAPQFNKIYPIIQESICLDTVIFSDFPKTLLHNIISYLNIRTKIIYASELNINSKKQEYIIDLTRKLNGDKFLFGKHGKDYVDIKLFNENKISALFQDYIHPRYNQFQDKDIFISNLGIIDLLMNYRADEVVQIILSNNIKKN